VIDTDKNNIPDTVENMSLADRTTAFKTMTNGPNIARNPVVHISQDSGGHSLSIGMDQSSINELSTMAQNLVSGLNCGFGGGGCMNFPINWAPLAPGSAPVAFGKPLSEFTPSTGIPIFSALTAVPLYGPW
jgi:hypothetical protein